MGLEIPDDWLPTAHNINALPGPLKKYIHDVCTNSDPSGMVAQNTILQDCNNGLQIMYRRAVDRLNELESEMQQGGVV